MLTSEGVRSRLIVELELLSRIPQLMLEDQILLLIAPGLVGVDTVHEGRLVLSGKLLINHPHSVTRHHLLLELVHEVATTRTSASVHAASTAEGVRSTAEQREADALVLELALKRS